MMATFSDRALLVHMDWYRKDSSLLPPSQRSFVNPEHPDAMDWELLLSQLRSLKDGSCVSPPRLTDSGRVYTAAMSCSKPIIIVVGPLALDAQIVSEFSLTLFLEADPLTRALFSLREWLDTGKDAESWIAYFEQNIVPTQLEVVEPTKSRAHFVTSWDHPYMPMVLAQATSRVANL